MNKYSHLKIEQRIEIYGYLKQKKSYRTIAKIMNVSHTTISREIKRNSIDKGRDKYEYKPTQAQKNYYQKRYKANQMHILLYQDHNMRRKIHGLLQEKGKYRGPDEILGRLHKEGFRKINTTTLYRFIRNYEPTWCRYLRYKNKGYRTNKKGNKYKRIYDDVLNIKYRSLEANERITMGHREGDTIVSNHKIKGGAITLVERKSGYVLIKKTNDHESQNVKNIITTITNNHNILSMTFDNGAEFAQIAKLPRQCYRADPYSSWQRGQNERTNGMIRRFIPKGANILDRSDDEIQDIQDQLNHKPRKRLGYLTPHEVYYGLNKQYLTT